MDTQEQIDALEAILHQLDDIKNSYGALVEKMARAQMAIDDLDEMDEASETVETAFGHASADHEAITSLADDLQMKVNQLQQA